MALVQTLTDRDHDHFGPALPPGLRELYGGDLLFRKSPAERPLVIANFVSTLDGVVSYEIKDQSGGSTVSGSDTADGFIMGLLRASADAIIVGARTVHDASPEGLWIPEYTYPNAKLCLCWSDTESRGESRRRYSLGGDNPRINGRYAPSNEDSSWFPVRHASGAPFERLRMPRWAWGLSAARPLGVRY